MWLVLFTRLIHTCPLLEVSFFSSDWFFAKSSSTSLDRLSLLDARSEMVLVKLDFSSSSLVSWRQEEITLKLSDYLVTEHAMKTTLCFHKLEITIKEEYQQPKLSRNIYSYIRKLFRKWWRSKQKTPIRGSTNIVWSYHCQCAMERNLYFSWCTL